MLIKTAFFLHLSVDFILLFAQDSAPDITRTNSLTRPYKHAHIKANESYESIMQVSLKYRCDGLYA
ncbi:hypothetical protein GCM10009133_32030 [Cocleimonas flava]|uniref:Uncharacterized protein n=1 Tax=Cocleimonas flava TaxID=634765 RepID=A0A4R1F893_9GAMM|nr:hypothetical protein EV695_0812 [Cocleimonas flava]